MASKIITTLVDGLNRSNEKVAGRTAGRGSDSEQSRGQDWALEPDFPLLSSQLATY